MGSNLLLWGYFRKPRWHFHENCWNYWSNFTAALIILRSAVKYYICKDASPGQPVSEKVWKQWLALKAVWFRRSFEMLCGLMLLPLPSAPVVTRLSMMFQNSPKSFCVLREIPRSWTWAEPCSHYELHNVSNSNRSTRPVHVLIIINNCLLLHHTKWWRGNMMVQTSLHRMSGLHSNVNVWKRVFLFDMESRLEKNIVTRSV